MVVQFERTDLIHLPWGDDLSPKPSEDHQLAKLEGLAAGAQQVSKRHDNERSGHETIAWTS